MKKRNCIICGKEFELKYGNQKICNDKHYINCIICNKPIELTKNKTINYLKKNYVTCSKKCSTEHMKQTNLKRYGNICSVQNKEIREHIEEQYIEKYGGNSPFYSKEIQQKSLEKRKNKSNQEKQNIRDKVKETNLIRYGDSNYNNPEKFKQTMQKRYGVNYTNESNELKIKQQNTMIKKYGVKCSFSKGSIRNNIDNKINNLYGKKGFVSSIKSRTTCMERYGVPYFVMTDKCRQLAHTPISQNNKRFKMALENYGYKPKLEFVIDKKQYDIKIENILIEIDPTYTHNSSIGPRFNKSNNIPPMDKYYHYNKTKLANKYNYRCIHIFDWDDKEKILNILKSKEKIYARKLKIKEVSKEECNLFLDKYHLQNTCKGQSIRLGLYLEDILIQIMTFGKPRYNKNYQYELLRLCTHFNYKVIGGAEKLFKYFIKNYNPKSIISYCDLAKFTGEVYIRLGFQLNKITSPSCRWSKGSKMITQNFLNQRGYDQLFGTNYGKGTSNKELMIQNGWREVYDCGQAVFIW